MSGFDLHLEAGGLTLADLRRLYRGPVRLRLTDASWEAIDRSRAAVEATLEAGHVTYGVNTGFGRLAQTQIAEDRLEELQSRLVQSHATGVGPDLDPSTVRLILALKVNSLARGFSGVRRRLVETLLAFLEHDITPAIPAQGSVGASGDLAPLAHLSLVALGLGHATVGGERVTGAEALDRLGLEPLQLRAKEGLALLNGTQVSTALALGGLFQAERLTSAALHAGAMTVDAALASRTPFDARIHDARGQRGQIQAASMLRDLLQESELGRSHRHCSRVQDPYCLRCQPQVMGACLDQMHDVARRLVIEANAASDNPLIFADGGDILSGGNFHAEPVAMAADNLALAIAEVGAISERRVALLVDSAMSQLPPFLVEDAGVNSGFMIAHVTAAALASENKGLAHPASVDSIPTSANQEDHVSMATHGARRLHAMAANSRHIVAIELLAAAQGLDLRRPLRSSAPLESAHATVRTRVDKWVEDRVFAPDIAAVEALIADGAFDDPVAAWLDRACAA
ncbi:MAG: histidine ammonia-lyase [Acidobacteriota bacterium]